MKRFGRLTVFASLVAGALLAATALTAQTKQASTAATAQQEKPKEGELSVKAVKLITGFALTTIPSEVKQSDGKVIKIDRKNLDKILVPLDDARRIIMVARNSAHAQMCDLLDYQADNYLAMMNSERAKNVWTPEQLVFINRLHLFTVMWLSGNVKFLEKDGKKEPQVIAETKTEKKVCSDAEKNEIKASILAFIKTVQKS